MNTGGQTVIFTVSSAREYLSLYFKRAQRDSRQFKFERPKPESLAQKIDQRQILTPWNSPLRGLRAGLFNETQARVLTREDSKVTWSQPLNHDVLAQLAAQFLERLEIDWRSLYLLCGDSLGQHKALTEAECERIFVASFVAPVKPRLIPRIQWPSVAERAGLVAEFLPSAPWKDERYGGLEVFTRDGGRYIFEAFGDRGEVYASLSSENPDDIYEQIFRYVTLFDHFDSDANFTFNSFYPR